MAVNVYGALLVCSVLEWGLLRMRTLSFPHWAGSICLADMPWARRPLAALLGRLTGGIIFLPPKMPLPLPDPEW